MKDCHKVSIPIHQYLNNCKALNNKKNSLRMIKICAKGTFAILNVYKIQLALMKNMILGELAHH